MNGKNRILGRIIWFFIPTLRIIDDERGMKGGGGGRKDTEMEMKDSAARRVRTAGPHPGKRSQREKGRRWADRGGEGEPGQELGHRVGRGWDPCWDGGLPCPLDILLSFTHAFCP